MCSLCVCIHYPLFIASQYVIKEWLYFFNLFSDVKSCGTHLLNFHFFIKWCIRNLIVSSFTWNVKPSSWHGRLESDSTTFLNSSLLNETSLTDLGASSKFLSTELNFWNQLLHLLQMQNKTILLMNKQ